MLNVHFAMRDRKGVCFGLAWNYFGKKRMAGWGAVWKALYLYFSMKDLSLAGSAPTNSSTSSPLR